MQGDRLVRHLKFRELDYLVTLGRISSIHRAAAAARDQPAGALEDAAGARGRPRLQDLRAQPARHRSDPAGRDRHRTGRADAVEPRRADGAARCRAPRPPPRLPRRRHAQSGAAPDPGRLHAGARRNFPTWSSSWSRRAPTSFWSACGAASIRSWSRDRRRRTVSRSSGRRRSIRRSAWSSAAATIRPPAATIGGFSRCWSIRGCCRSSGRHGRRSSARSCAPDAIRRRPRSSTMRRNSSATSSSVRTRSA